MKMATSDSQDVDSAETSPPAASDESIDSSPLAEENAPSPNWRWFWLGLLIAVAPLLIPYFMDLWDNETYRYFPFALAAVGWLGYVRSDHQFYPPRGWVSWSAIVFAMLLLVFGLILQFSWFAAVAMVLVAGAMLHSMRGMYDTSLIALVLPLMTVVRLIRVDDLLVQYLQTITTWLSSVLLDAFTVPHAVANNVIQLADR